MYRELRPPDGVSHFACGWLADGAGASVLPDACVDVVLGAGRLMAAGPATMAVEVAPTAGRECRRLTGRTPTALRAAGATAAGERTSEAFKPIGPRSTTLDR